MGLAFMPNSSAEHTSNTNWKQKHWYLICSILLYMTLDLCIFKQRPILWNFTLQKVPEEAFVEHHAYGPS